MEMALYQPKLGYYTSAKNRIGKRGDFFTSPYISRAFGAMIGRQIEQIWQQMPGNFKIIEYGAGNGLLAYDILQYLKNNMDCYHSIQYVIIEKSPEPGKTSRQFTDKKLHWIKEIKELGAFEGCIISNELFDNFPVHKVCTKNGRLMDIAVDYDRRFLEVAMAAPGRITEYCASVQLELAENTFTEICLDIEDWYQSVSKYLHRGYIITIDYGYLNAMQHRKKNPAGSIRSYKDHLMMNDPYQYPGEVDITADVNFSAMIYWGCKHGFDFTGFVNQRSFLKALGFVPYLSDMGDAEENKKWACSMLLDQMGTSFKVLIQQKSMPGFSLRGLLLQHPIEKKMGKLMVV
jgi:SAM-dependent MidA family methyltransferase